jgi:hypothetical protein
MKVALPMVVLETSLIEADALTPMLRGGGVGPETGGCIGTDVGAGDCLAQLDRNTAERRAKRREKRREEMRGMACGDGERPSAESSRSFTLFFTSLFTVFFTLFFTLSGLFQPGVCFSRACQCFLGRGAGSRDVSHLAPRTRGLLSVKMEPHTRLA